MSDSPQIKLVPVRDGVRASDEDWYLQVSGQNYGYLYRSGQSYAVGVAKPNQEVTLSSIEPSKDAALAYAAKHITAILDEQKRDEGAMAVVKLARAWREKEGYVGRGGVVVIYPGKEPGWVNKLRNPDHWMPGCVAVDEEGRTWTAIAGTDQHGALMWLPNDPLAEGEEE